MESRNIFTFLLVIYYDEKLSTRSFILTRQQKIDHQSNFCFCGFVKNPTVSRGDSHDFCLLIYLSSNKVNDKKEIFTLCCFFNLFLLLMFRSPCQYFQIPLHASQNSFTNSSQKVADQSMCRNTSLRNHAATLVLPDATLQIVPHVNIIERYRALNIVSIREAYHQRRYCLVANRKRVQVFCSYLSN